MFAALDPESHLSVARAGIRRSCFRDKQRAHRRRAIEWRPVAAADLSFPPVARILTGSGVGHLAATASHGARARAQPAVPPATMGMHSSWEGERQARGLPLRDAQDRQGLTDAHRRARDHHRFGVAAGRGRDVDLPGGSGRS